MSMKLIIESLISLSIIKTVDSTLFSVHITFSSADYIFQCSLSIWTLGGTHVILKKKSEVTSYYVPLLHRKYVNKEILDLRLL